MRSDIIMRQCGLPTDAAYTWTFMVLTYNYVYEASEDDYRLFVANYVTYVFVSFWPPHLCPSDGHKHGVSINHTLINLSNTLCFFEYLPHKTSHRPETLRDCSNKLFIFFASPILDFKLNGFDNGVTVETSNIAYYIGQ